MSVQLPLKAQRASLALLLALLWLHPRSRAQEGELDKSPPKGVTPEQVIQRFSAKEKEWKKAREQYTFRQTIRAQALDGESENGSTGGGRGQEGGSISSGINLCCRK